MSAVMRGQRVGVVGPLTGPRAAYGEWLRKAVQGSSLPLIWADDAADPVVAVAAARRLLAGGAGVVIGHFNSECARSAGALYQAAGVPLLLPAATAPDLCRTVGAFRLCASELQQVITIVDYLAQVYTQVEEFWSDGSPYGERLASALQQRLLPMTLQGASQSVCALMGSHVAVAAEIRRRARPGTVYLVPDDCVVEEFGELLAGTGAITLCPHATPDFGDCARMALRFVAAAVEEGCAVREYLDAHADFDQGQYRHAGYIMKWHEYSIFPGHDKGRHHHAT
ncbi:ABC transporter substrate-binding protein [Pseudomonas orientalis]|nr:ABC transporter substrate-binding protein [Pseudomonas orientalis]KRP64278.1 hypothetical protein TU82_18430 [Pseudomonas orientalis]